jgi:hypothetical protein
MSAGYLPVNQESGGAAEPYDAPTFEAVKGVRRELKRNMLLSSNRFSDDSQSMSVAYLEKFNPEQRRAAEHGVREKACTPCCTPLLVIAGAGADKTNTLAHRVAHLIVNGADPRESCL